MNSGILLPDDFQISQASLSAAMQCLRRFWLRYVRRVQHPAPIAAPLHVYEEHIQRGERFHTLVQQALNGVPVDHLTATVDADPLLVGWWANWQQHGRALLPPNAAIAAEVTYTAPAPGRADPLASAGVPLRLIAKCDVVAATPDRLLIIDWKTTQRPTSPSQLADRWQTRIYRWVLARSFPARPPEAITMVYWSTADPTRPIALPYSAAQYAADQASLARLIEGLLLALRDGEAAFPKTEDGRQCRFCSYRTLCDRGSHAADAADCDEEAADDDDLTLALDQIAEVVF